MNDAMKRKKMQESGNYFVDKSMPMCDLKDQIIEEKR
jgi:hypothetical protein